MCSAQASKYELILELLHESGTDYYNHRQSRHYRLQRQTGAIARLFSVNQVRFKGFGFLNAVKGRCAFKRTVFLITSSRISPKIRSSPRSTERFAAPTFCTDITRNMLSRTKWFEGSMAISRGTTLVHLKSWTNGDNGTS